MTQDNSRGSLIFDTRVFIDRRKSTCRVFLSNEVKHRYYEEWYEIIDRAYRNLGNHIAFDGDDFFEREVFFTSEYKFQIDWSFCLERLHKVGLLKPRRVSIASLVNDEFSFLEYDYLVDVTEAIGEGPIVIVPFYIGGKMAKVIDGNVQLSAAINRGDSFIDVIMVNEDVLINHRVFSSEFERLIYAFICENTQLIWVKTKDSLVSDKTLMNNRFNEKGVYRECQPLLHEAFLVDSAYL